MPATEPSALSGREALSDLYILDADRVDELAWEPVPGSPGVVKKLLWHLGDYTQALIRYDPGSSTPGDPLLAAHQHVWVLQGTATIAGRVLRSGSYLHIPPGYRHRVSEVGAEGCTLLQMHRPHAPVEAEALSGESSPQRDDDDETALFGERIDSESITGFSIGPHST